MADKYYKSARYIKGKLRIIISDENDNIICENPTKEQIKAAIPDKRRKSKGYLEGRTCFKCGTNLTHKSSEGVDQWCRYLDDDNRWNGKWLCFNCSGKYHQSNDCNSQQNLIKSIRNPRIGNIRKDSEQGMVIICQAVVAKLCKTEDLNIKMDNYNWHVDMYNDEHRRINVEYSFFRFGYGWMFNSRRVNSCKTKNENKNDNYDTYILLCISKDGNDIERVLIVPSSRVRNIWTIGINIDDRTYYMFAVDPGLCNDIYHDIMRYLKNKEYFGVDDVRQWMNSYIVEQT